MIEKKKVKYKKVFSKTKKQHNIYIVLKKKK